MTFLAGRLRPSDRYANERCVVHIATGRKVDGQTIAL